MLLEAPGILARADHGERPATLLSPTWQKVVIPVYPTPESLPVCVAMANKLIMATGGTPTIPLLSGQGANGELKGTSGDQRASAAAS